MNKIVLSYRTAKADARTAIGAHAAEMEITGGSYYDNSRLQLQMITVEMCQLNPLLPNQSDCLSHVTSNDHCRDVPTQSSLAKPI